MLIRLLLLIALSIIQYNTYAANNEYYNLTWKYDSAKQEVVISHFIVHLCIDRKCTNYTVEGSNSRSYNNIVIDKDLKILITATVKACSRKANICSGDSNTAMIDREPPQPPSYIRYIPGVR